MEVFLIIILILILIGAGWGYSRAGWAPITPIGLAVILIILKLLHVL